MKKINNRKIIVTIITAIIILSIACPITLIDQKLTDNKIKMGDNLNLNITSPISNSSPGLIPISKAIQTNEYTVTSLDITITCLPKNKIVYSDNWVPSNGPITIPISTPVEGKYEINVIHNGIDSKNQTISLEETVIVNIGTMIITTVNIIPGYICNINVDAADAIYIESAQNVKYGYGTFGDPPKHLAKSNGTFLVPGTDYNNDATLDIYDIKNNSVFDTGKYFRVLNGTSNAATSLNLTPVAKNLSSIISPPADQIYIDPENGCFVMPRPAYWSKCENINNIVNAEIYNEKNKPVLPTAQNFGLRTGKFNNCLFIQPPSETVRYFSPFGGRSDFDKITFSAYVRLMNDPGAQSRFCLYFNIQDPSTWTYVCLQNRRTNGEDFISVNGNTTNPHNDGLHDGMHHIYIVADKNAGLNNGNSIAVYINGQKVLSTTQTFNFNTLTLWFQNIQNDGWIMIDNIKIWDHIVSEDPSWIYNGGAGRSEALHLIYGAENNYMHDDLKVGYYYGE